MTLILGLASSEFAVLVSDRRLTFYRGNSVERMEDTENKALVLANLLVMGYTGLARLPLPSSGQSASTAWFAAEVFAGERDTRYWLKSLATSTESALRNARLPLAQKGHAYLGAGWNTAQDLAEPFPTLALVSNARTATDQVGTWRPRQKFQTTARCLLNPAPGEVLLDAVGLAPPPKLFKAYRGKIRYRRRVDPNAIVPTIELMIELARETAELNAGVGKDFMVTVMPKSALSDQMISAHASGISDPVSERIAGFVPEGRSLATSHIYAPLLITDDGMVMGGGYVNFGADLPPQEESGL